MVIENDPSARMQYRSAGELKVPATCAVCGAGDREEGYVDLDLFVEFHGSVYLCMICFTQAADLVGMFTPEQVAHLTKQIETLLEENQLLTSELADANERNRNLSGVLASQFNVSNDVPNGKNPDSNPTESVKAADSGESEVKEPTLSKIPARVGGPKLHDITFD